MKKIFRFIKRFIVTLLAVLGFGVLAAGIGFWVFKTSVQPSPILKEKSILELSLEGTFTEHPVRDPLQRMLKGDHVSFYETLQTLEAALDDPNIIGLFVTLENPNIGLAQLQELRGYFEKFSRAGKTVYVHAQSFGEFNPATPLYYAASAADHLSIQPMGMLCLTGLVAETPFLRGFLDWLGVTPQFARRERFKSFPETFTEKQMTGPAKEALTALLQNLSHQMIEGIAKGRKQSVDHIEGVFTKAPLSDVQGKAAGLVDTICYGDEARQLLREKTSRAPLISFATYQKFVDKKHREKTKPSVALLFGEGMIVPDAPPSILPTPGAQGTIAENVLLPLLKKLEKEKHIKALVYRIDSGGGHALASDSIRHALQQLRKAGKKVVISMGNVAASGGYMIALGADRIVAQPMTLTGSIGVFGGKFSLEAFWKNWNVNWETLATHPQGAMVSPHRPFSEKELQILHQWTDQLYGHFLHLTSTARNLSDSATQQVAQGRVWTGQQAHDLRLVDRLGGLMEAIEEAKQLAKLPPSATVGIYPHPKSLFELVVEMLTGTDLEQKEAAAVFSERVQICLREGFWGLISGFKGIMKTIGLYPFLMLKIE